MQSLEGPQDAALAQSLSSAIKNNSPPRADARLQEARVVATAAMREIGVRPGVFQHDWTGSFDLEPATQYEMLTFLETKGREAMTANSIAIAVICRGPTCYDCWVFGASELQWDCQEATSEHVLPGDVCNREGNKVGSLIIRPLLFRAEDVDTGGADAPDSSDDESEPLEPLESATAALSRVDLGELADAVEEAAAEGGGSDFELVERPAERLGP